MAETKIPPFNPEVGLPPKKDEGEGDEELTPKKTPKDGDDEIDEDEEKEEGEDTELEDDKIPVRKSTAQFIIARQKKTIEKLRDEKEEEEAPEEEDDELTPEAKTAVEKAIERKVNPLLGTLAQKADDDELQDLFTREPEAAKYEKRIKSYMKNPHWQAVPVEAIYHHLAFDSAETTGANKKNNADRDANLNKGGGRTLRPKTKETGDLPSKEEMEDMTDDELEAIQHKARTGQFLEE